jgi:peptide chain release factor 1
VTTQRVLCTSCLVCTQSAQHSTVFSAEILDERPGYVAFSTNGDWSGESGGHRWQRVPPNEKRGRVHTSTVTVAVLAHQPDARDKLLQADVTETVTRGSGAGGQHRNTTDSAVRVRHDPTGITVFISSERSQHANRAVAWRVLSERVAFRQQTEQLSSKNRDRKLQLGSGARGDKRRTYRSQDDSVHDHVTGERTSLTKWMTGNW